MIFSCDVDSGSAIPASFVLLALVFAELDLELEDVILLVKERRPRRQKEILSL